MSCPDCTAASTVANWPGYRAGCRGCSIRALATGVEFFKSAEAGMITSTYRMALISLLGGDWLAAHEEVKAEHERLQKLKGQK